MKLNPWPDNHLIGIQDLCKLIETALHVLHVGDQHVDDAAPGLIKGFVPDAGPEAGAVQRLAKLLEVLLPLWEDHLPLVLLHQVHLVDQAEDLCIWTVLKQVVVIWINKATKKTPGGSLPDRTGSSASLSLALCSQHRTHRSAPSWCTSEQTTISRKR